MVDARTLPHSLDAERSVLGAALVSNDLIDAAAEIVQPADFFRAAHQTLWRHILRLHDRRDPVDFVTLKESLSTANDLDEIGGPAYLASLLDGVPHSSNVEHYAAIVREKATLRELIAAANKTLIRAYDADEAAVDVLDSTQADIFNIHTNRQRGGFMPLCDVLTGEVMPALERAVEQKRAVTGVASGLTDLDAMLSGFQQTDLIIIAARPSMGKTALVLEAAKHAALREGANVGIFSLEMSKRQLGLRALMSEAGVDGHRMRTGFLGERDYGRIAAAMNALANAKLHIDDTPAVGLHEVRARARKLKATVGLDLLVVDYIQLMKGEKAENRNLQIAALSAGLKALAKELDIAVIALSQLSRALESRSDKRPMLSDLRESGALEQDADVVIFVYRDEVYNEQTDQAGVAELIVSKQRNGPTGTVKVGFEKAHTRFFNMTTRVA
jgi:replicative DNA helicase